MTNLILAVTLAIAGAAGVTTKKEKPDYVSSAERTPDRKLFLQQAEAAYHEGLAQRANGTRAKELFLKAALNYEKAIETGLRHSAVARTAAHANLLAGRLPEAIRLYRIGLTQSPHDKDLQAGLALARARVEYPNSAMAESCRQNEPWSLLHSISEDDLLSVGELLWMIGWLVAARAWMVRTRFWRYAAFLLLGSSLVTICWMEAAANRLDVRGRSVWHVIPRPERPDFPAVLTDSSMLHSGNGAEYPTRFADKLPAGVELHIVGERGGWVQVRLAGGTVGWVEKSCVLPISSRSADEPRRG